MPSLTKLLSRNSISKEKEAAAEQPRPSIDHSAAPPVYTENPPAYDKDDIESPPSLTAGFANLRITDDSPKRDLCIAHLKLLECFYRLRQQISSTDGLFGICNSALKDANDGQECIDPKILSMLGEKRWAIYVCKAVDRFERWRDIVAPSRNRMTTDESQKGGRLEKMITSTPSEKTIRFDGDNLPPLGKSFSSRSPVITSLTNSFRRPHGLAFLHAQPASISRRLHSRWKNAAVVY